MLSAKTQLADKVRGFERGADDYVAKPFEPSEMLVRVQSLLKRTALARLTALLRKRSTGSSIHPLAWRRGFSITMRTATR